MAGNKRNGKHGDGGTAALINALHHPLRRELLKLILERDELSPVEASEILGRSLSNVSYHVRVLAEGGALDLTGTKPRRGSIQHFYSASRDVKVAEWIRLALPPDDSAAAA